MTITNIPLFALWISYCQRHFDAMPADMVAEFACYQFEVVEEALHFGKGIRACTSRAHDLTCRFVEEQLSKGN